MTVETAIKQMLLQLTLLSEEHVPDLQEDTLKQSITDANRTFSWM